MRYCSLDLETTGLEPDKDQILQVGACIADERGEIFYELDILVAHDRYEGDPFALNMNAWIFEKLAHLTPEDFKFDQDGPGTPPRAVHINDLRLFLHRWLWIPFQKNRVIFAGKNIDSYDKLFLQKIDFFKPGPFPIDFGHVNGGASLDPGVLWYDPARDVKIPKTAECCRRAGIDNTVTHNALEDARQTVQLITKYWEKIAKLEQQASCYNAKPMKARVVDLGLPRLP